MAATMYYDKDADLSLLNGKTVGNLLTGFRQSETVGTAFLGFFKQEDGHFLADGVEGEYSHFFGKKLADGGQLTDKVQIDTII